jgi:pheromone shutdown protein TraB
VTDPYPDGSPAGSSGLYTKLVFWLLVVAGLVVVVAALAGSKWALVLVGLAVAYLVLIAIGGVRLRPARSRRRPR